VIWKVTLFTTNPLISNLAIMNLLLGNFTLPTFNFSPSKKSFLLINFDLNQEAATSKGIAVNLPF
jgi:hypothetical protein